ncbi:MAG: uroporphyrinogen decarboxylase family protein [Sporomusaceae bacterium]|nr:uroporphyrinogen decarboxylase family protein [Sporomusaceae bacterium]
MSQSKRELVRAALNNEPVDRVPVGFWHHFLENPEQTEGLGQPEVAAANLAGHSKFYQAFKPDFVKIMSDGFFHYPYKPLYTFTSVKEAAAIAPIGADAPWIEEQVKLVKAATALFGGEVLSFYNIFAAPRYLEFTYTAGNANDNFVRLLQKDKAALKHILDVMSEDLALLAKRVIADGGADGIYLSVQNIPRPEVTRQIYEEVIAPAEKKILAAANAVSDTNILHICGYEGNRNDLTWYKDYAVKAINYAAVVEGVSLSEAKRIFGGRTVIGGLDNTRNSPLYKGSRAEVDALTEAIIKDAGKTGVIIGADCTVPEDIDLQRLNWVRDKAAALSAK